MTEFAWIVLILLALQAPAAPAPPAAPTPLVDPAAAVFATEVGLLLAAVKPDKAADYEAALQALQGALASTSDPARRRLAQGWRVYKAAEPDAKGNTLYVHALVPAMPGVDYRPSLLLDDLLTEAPTELLAKYRDALAGPPTRLSLTEVANMAVAPVKK
ncbi:MAG: hypothetical protein OEW19_01460 [Acidobacteriota bacterium]|nr:hypothetical protein [Acidobacteriota bacterium]